MNASTKSIQDEIDKTIASATLRMKNLRADLQEKIKSHGDAVENIAMAVERVERDLEAYKKKEGY